jgi:hypothetical protein
MAGVTSAKRKLHSLARNGGNWRLKGMYLAELPKTEFSRSDVAKAWPTNKSDYRFLSEDHKRHMSYAPDRTIAFSEESDDYRRLSDATRNADWNDGGDGVKEIHADKLIKRALAYGETNEEFNTLWREQLYDSVIEGSRKKQIARDAAMVVNVETSSGDHPRAGDADFADEIAEGAAIPDDRQDYDTVEWDTVKFGKGARFTEELIDHSLIDLIEAEIEKIGRDLENSLNRQFVTELVDNADSGNDVDTSAASDRDVASVNQAITNIDLSDFEATTLVTHPEYRQTLFDSDNLVYANRAGSDEGIRQRTYNPLFDLNMVEASNGMLDPDSGNTWGFSSADEYGGVVYNEDRLGIYMYSDIEIKDYEDPIRDLSGINGRMQTDVTFHQPASAARLQY